MHRWISRRSLLLTSRWESTEAAEVWIASPEFRAFDEAARAIGGTEAWTELREHPFCHY
jgi:heme-degrading monooxygenase HmoA